MLNVIMERVLFIGPRIPMEIKSMIKPLQDLDKSTFRQLVQLVVSDIEHKPISNGALESIINKSGSSTREEIEIIFAGLYSIVKSALRVSQNSLKSEVFQEDLKELKFPPEFITDLTNIIYGSRRPLLDEQILKNTPKNPYLKNVKWRVDVVISSSVLNRVLQPSVLMEMTLSDGKIHMFEIPVSKFHQLRYNVAAALKEMEDLEKRNIFKIQD